MSAELLEMSTAEVTPESRKVVGDACESLVIEVCFNSHMPRWQSRLIFLQLDRDFVTSFAKRVTDARKKVLEGFGRGISRICAAH